jgi:hypothetical protein
VPAGAGESADTQGPGQAFDAAPFGFCETMVQGKAYGVRWGEPRKIRRLVVEFPPDADLSEKDGLKLQYWHRAWNGRADRIETEVDPSAEGWAQMDDWTNGQWKDADARAEVQGKTWTFTFAPTGQKDIPGAGAAGVAYRKTLKVRVLGDKPLPKPVRLQALTDAVCQPLTVRILFGPPAASSVKIDGDDAGRLEVFNGTIRALRPLAGSGATVAGGAQWTLPGGGSGGLEADLLMAVDPVSERYDRTIVTVRSKFRPFSFTANEVARGDRILVNDLGVLAVRGDDAVTLEGYRQKLKEFPGRTVYDRIFGVEEQSLSRAWNEMPLKRPLNFVHGMPGNRNAMRQDPNGEITVTASGHWFNLFRSPKDSDRKGWQGDYLTLFFGFPPGDRRAGRELLDGYLPLLRTWWVDGPIYYEQLTILDKLEPDLKEVRLDDPTLLLMRVRMVNTSATTPGAAKLRLSCHAQGDEKLVVDGDRALAQGQGGGRLRYLVKTGGGTLAQDGNSVAWSLDLAPGASHEVFFAIPSVTLTKDEEIAALRKREFQADSRRVCEFWKELTARGAQIDTPEPWLNGFYKAHVRHLEVNCLRDLGTAHRYAHVGTFSYGVYTNESAMMVSDLDRRGYHQAAEQCLQTWLDFQGTVGLPGNFKGKEGLIYGAAGEESGGYNKHHGYGMWCLAEHWRYTRDRKWMESAAPKLVKACEWVIRERQGTINPNEDGSRPIEYGFLPSGGLEDVQDYWYWLATNSATVWGFDALTEALADFGHPEAARLQKEAKAYHDDVVRGLTETRIRTPVVRLRDGTYVPKFPSHLHERGRCYGWIRETLEGSIFLLTHGLVPAESLEAQWIMKDYEDNLYISDRYGYSIPVFETFWFSRGGFSMQANLLDGPIPYLARDEVKHYLRTFFNGLASGFYPEIKMCNEHSAPELGYPRGDHFKTSDEAQLTYWLRLMFVDERGSDLYLGRAIPRYWLTDGRSVGIERAASHFGPLSLRIASRTDKGEIEAVIDPPKRNPPQNIYLRLRHPKGKPIQGVTLNGKPYDRFDPKKEWIVLPGKLEGAQTVVARY